MTIDGLTRRLRARADELGVGLFGVTRLMESGHSEHYQAWLSAGHHGSMAYLAREDAIARRADLSRTLRDARAAVVVGVDYRPHGPSPAEGDSSLPVIARYARGRDYHDVLPETLEALGAVIRDDVPDATCRVYVDTGPLLERELARDAGLGWFGRNTMLIHPERGSWFVLGVLLTDVALTPTEPFDEDRCGTCNACVEACPTGALLGRNAEGAPVLDARRCISYLTIEAKGAIPVELRRLLGNRVFGCDICQEVCPWNERFGQVASDTAFTPRADLDGADLVALAERLLEMSEKGYQRAFAGSPLTRPRRRGMLRNLCVGLGNWAAAQRGVDVDRATTVLGRALEDAQPLVRRHAAWALGRVGSETAERHLLDRLELEQDEEVRVEITRAAGVVAES